MPAPVLDPTRLDKLHRIGGRELVVQLLDSFLSQADARRTVLRGTDLPAIGATAHQLVAGAGQLGAARLAETARQVDEAIRTAQQTHIPQLITAFDEAVAALAHARETA